MPQLPRWILWIILFLLIYAYETRWEDSAPMYRHDRWTGQDWRAVHDFEVYENYDIRDVSYAPIGIPINERGNAYQTKDLLHYIWFILLLINIGLLGKT